MNFRRTNGDIDWAGFTAIAGLAITVLIGYTHLVLNPVIEDVIENKADIKTNSAVARRVEITVNRVDVLMTKQNETLGNLAETIDKLADRIDNQSTTGSQ
jgi:hypothetical protein|tara:strand:- start:405 stop:704 length:300 start_codon:yes stop_codon:yes gene_type:complete